MKVKIYSSYLSQKECPDRLPGDPHPELTRQRQDRSHQPRHPPHRRPVLRQDVQDILAHADHASLTVVIYLFGINIKVVLQCLHY